MPRRLLWILTSVFVGAAHAQDSAAPPPGELAAATAAQLDSYLPRLFDNEPDPAKRLAAIAAATMGQRYAESPLGEGTYDSRDPKPLYALDRSDSRSFVEQALAMAVSRDFGAFFLILQRLRYIDGQVSTTQRHHNLLADWAPRNAWLLSNVTRECSEGMAWVPSHQVVRRARFLQDRFNITTDIPDEKFIGDFIPRCFAVQALDDLRGGDVVLLITGDDRQQFCTELGILLKDPTAANRSTSFTRSRRPSSRSPSAGCSTTARRSWVSRSCASGRTPSTWRVPKSPGWQARSPSRVPTERDRFSSREAMMRTTARDRHWLQRVWLTMLVFNLVTPSAWAGRRYRPTITVEPDVICVGCTAIVTVQGVTGDTWCGHLDLPSNLSCFADGAACDQAVCKTSQVCPVIQQCVEPPPPWPGEPGNCTGCPPAGCGPSCQQVGGLGTTQFTILGTGAGRGTISGYGTRYVHSNGSPLSGDESCAAQGGIDWWEECADITVVGVASVKWLDPVTPTWNAITGTLNIFKDTPVTFRAFPSPEDAQFPGGKPEWGGSSGASGSGETTTVTFGDKSQTCQDYKTVTVSCSSVPPNPPLTLNTIVYELNKNFIPGDNFAGRSYDSYGLAEDVTLGVTADPCGGDPGTWVSLGYPPAVPLAGFALVCAHVPCSHVLKYKITSGPSKDRGPAFSIGVVAPTANCVQFNNCGCAAPGCQLHIINDASAGFYMEIYFHPTNVSFHNLWFVEGSCPATVTGYWEGRGSNHLLGSAISVGFGNITTGCPVAFDTVAHKSNPPPYSGLTWSGGTWDWPIPWYYGFSGSVTGTQFTTANHHEEIDSNGTITISKKGITVIRAVSDPNCLGLPAYPW